MRIDIGFLSDLCLESYFPSHDHQLAEDFTSRGCPESHQGPYLRHAASESEGEEEEEPGRAQLVYHDPDRLLLKAKNWRSVVRFARDVGWHLMVDFTAFFHSNGKWIPKVRQVIAGQGISEKNKDSGLSVGKRQVLQF
ncbi:hypothetical protein Btru_037643 [Bulinus truncatus]|nr:hypothetical protein Btru_037643 [Bulinus truncatus]